MRIWVRACQVARSGGMGTPSTASLTEVMALLRRKRTYQDTEPTVPASARTATRRAGEVALTACRSVPECMSQASAWIQWSRWMHIRPTTPAMTPVAIVATARRRV